MSYPPGPQDPYRQQPPQPQPQPQQYGYPPQQQPQAAPPHGSPQQPQSGQPQGYGYPQPGNTAQPGYDPNAAAYAYGQHAVPPSTVPAEGYLTLATLGTVKLATMGQRLLARLIDGVILGVVIGIAMVLGLASTIGLSHPQTCDPSSADYQTCMDNAQAMAAGVASALFLMLIVISLLMLLYEWLMISLLGATLGKMAMKLRVVKDKDGALPGLGSGFIRYIIPAAGSSLCGIGQLLVYISPFFDNSGRVQGWHDRAASTVVIRKGE